ncbi:ABC transporter ATP-binding protein [Streptomyces sp. NRRL F-5630]|uniref:ABC transporter ATP-binding protein n=1 Tax=Streptomyces sp. NRRL F-5630 TaxID=1463864 RepID=UPI00056B3703|nr:ABC transporter ATP-binding protein [Streptomyces sp. NRRL F-5630]
MIQVENLSKRYGDTLAVDDLSFTVTPGKVTGFLGPNGAGKSTTMRMILGLDRPTAGRALIAGRPYEELERPLTVVGALLDAKGVHGARTAYHHLLALAVSNGLPPSRVDEVLEMVGLTTVARKRAKGFSLGMGQRLGVAAALLGRPDVVVLDEPVNGLDPEGVLWARELMKRLASEGRTVLVSSHLMNEMAVTADHLVIIARGRLLVDSPMNEFIDQHSHASVTARVSDPEALKDALDTEGIRSARLPDGRIEALDVTPERVGELASDRRIAVYEMGRRTASLEQAFMELTSEQTEYRAVLEVGR